MTANSAANDRLLAPPVYSQPLNAFPVGIQKNVEEVCFFCFYLMSKSVYVLEYN